MSWPGLSEYVVLQLETYWQRLPSKVKVTVTFDLWLKSIWIYLESNDCYATNREMIQTALLS